MSYCKCDRCVHDDKNGGTEKACERCVGWNGDEFLFKDVDSAIYPNSIMRRLRERMGLDPDDNSRDEEIELMSKREVFENILEWEGFIGYTSSIIQWINDIFDVNLDE